MVEKDLERRSRVEEDSGGWKGGSTGGHLNFHLEVQPKLMLPVADCPRPLLAPWAGRTHARTHARAWVGKSPGTPDSTAGYHDFSGLSPPEPLMEASTASKLQSSTAACGKPVIILVAGLAGQLLRR